MFICMNIILLDFRLLYLVLCAKINFAFLFSRLLSLYYRTIIGFHETKSDLSNIVLPSKHKAAVCRFHELIL